jgi:hypothetical protein
VQIGDNRAAEWVRRSNPVALGLLFSGLAGQDFTFCTAAAILRCTFCPALLPSAREMRDIVKNDLTA